MTEKRKKRGVRTVHTGRSVYLTEQELDLVIECIFELRDSGHPFTEDEEAPLNNAHRKLSRAAQAIQAIKDQQND